MPVIFGPYLKRARKRVTPGESVEEEPEAAETEQPTNEKRPVRRFALGVAIGAAIGWLLGRKKS